MRHSTVMRKTILNIVGLLVVGFGVGAAPKGAATRPGVTRAAGQQGVEAKGNAAVTRAVGVLVKEFQTHLKDPVNELRKESDYFVREPDGDVTQEAILAGLEKRQNGDLRIDGYVKWQLLSGVKGKFDAKLAARALGVYQRAPQAVIRPGTDEADKRQLQQMLPNRVEGAEVADEYNREWNEKVFRAAQANGPILRYRNELFGKLPPSVAAFRLGLQDAYTRVMNGYAADLFVEEIEKEIRDWSREGKPAELVDLADLLGGLEREMTGKNPRSAEYLTQVHFNSKENKLSWEKGRANFAKEKDLEDLAGYLHNRAQAAAAGGKK
jgi:hypothetical protein